jgi:ribosomal protein S18 acetylase RimI-like enzyme
MEEPVLTSRMADPALVQALETRLVNAWPALETQIVDQWVLRFAKGYSKRANSASPMAPVAALDDAAIDQIVDQFAVHGLRPTFRLTGLEAADVDGRLAARGFVEIEPTFGMVAPLWTLATEPEVAVDPAVAIEPKPKARWLKDVAAAYGGDKADHTRLTEIVQRIRQPAGFATLTIDDRPSAWGLAVIERGFVGLFDLVVAPELRGLGLGKQIVCALAGWARKGGAEQAYLQVRAENEVARDLYRALGFTDAYRYTHRVSPGPP